MFYLLKTGKIVEPSQEVVVAVETGQQGAPTLLSVLCPFSRVLATRRRGKKTTSFCKTPEVLQRGKQHCCCLFCGFIFVVLSAENKKAQWFSAALVTQSRRRLFIQTAKKLWEENKL